MTADRVDLIGLIAQGDLEAVAAALEDGADPDAGDRWGVTPLAHAAGRGDVALVRLLLEHGARCDKTSAVGNSPLMAAVARGNLDVIEALLAAGADPQAKNKWGLGADDWARWPANGAEVEALLRSRR